MNILITGGAGYIGSVLVGKLLSAKTQLNMTRGSKSSVAAYSNEIEFDKVVVYDNLLYRQVCLTDFSYRQDFEFVHGDVRDSEMLLPYVQRADVIIPLAAIVGFPACMRYPQEATDINYGHVDFILKNTTDKQYIIYPNTNSGYGFVQGADVCTEDMPLKPISHYGRTKCDAEDAVLNSGRGIVLRLATVFGVSPRMRLDLLVNDFTYKAVNDGYIVLFEKEFRRDYIHVRDVALTFVYMINRYSEFMGQVFNVVIPNSNISKLELAQKIKLQLPNFSIQCDEFTTDVDQRNYVVSGAKLEATGWRPVYSIEDGITELINAYGIIRHNNNRNYTNL